MGWLGSVGSAGDCTCLAVLDLQEVLSSRSSVASLHCHLACCLGTLVSLIGLERSSRLREVGGMGLGFAASVEMFSSPAPRLSFNRLLHRMSESVFCRCARQRDGSEWFREAGSSASVSCQRGCAPLLVSRLPRSGPSGWGAGSCSPLAVVHPDFKVHGSFVTRPAIEGSWHMRAGSHYLLVSGGRLGRSRVFRSLAPFAVDRISGSGVLVRCT